MDLRAQGFACRGLTRLIGLPGKEKTGQRITPCRRIDLPGLLPGLFVNQGPLIGCSIFSGRSIFFD